jgi:hypothetical protein
MKPLFCHKRFLTALVLSTVCLLSQQSLAFADPVVSGVYSDLYPYRPEELFRQWQQKVDREIQRLTAGENALSEPEFENNVNPQSELERLPQLQPDTFSQPVQESSPQK